MIFRAYWKDVILEYICNSCPDKELSIKFFSEEMGINPNDIVSTLQVLGMIKYWKGQHVILKREDLIDEYMLKARAKLVRSGRPVARMTINQVSSHPCSCCRLQDIFCTTCLQHENPSTILSFENKYVLVSGRTCPSLSALDIF